MEYIAERFLVCHQRVGVVAAHWHPGSPNSNHVVMLATDHYLRVYSLRSRDVPEQALAITVPRPDNIFSQHNEGTTPRQPSKLGGAVLGEEAVDFTIAAPVMPNAAIRKVVSSDVGEGGDRRDSYAAAAELLWPVFVLYANGDVYHTNLTLHPHKLRSRSVTGPLLLLPARQDNYGLEWCSVTWLGEPGGGGGVLVLATCGGSLYHCVVMPPQPPQRAADDAHAATSALALQNTTADETPLLKELSSLSVSPPGNAAAVSLFVYESVDLELTLCPDDQQQMLCPIVLCKDDTAPNRYLAVHAAGVHAVTVPLVDSLRQFALTADAAQPEAGAESECSVEHLVCTRALPSSAPLPVTGAALCARNTTPASRSHSSNELFVLLATGTILSVRLPSILLSVPLPDQFDDTASNIKSELQMESFDSLIQAVLQRGCSQPVLACGATSSLDPVEALDLTNRTLHTLRTQYIAPQATAQQHILHRVRVLCDQQRALCSQLNSVQQQRQQLVQQTETLQQMQEETRQRQQDITDRLDAVVSTALRRVPGLSGGERWLLKQLQSIQEQLPHLHDDVQHLHTKLNWHTNSLQVESPTEASAEAADLKLSQQQLHTLKKSIGTESEKIEKLVSRFNGLQKNLQL